MDQEKYEELLALLKSNLKLTAEVLHFLKAKHIPKDVVIVQEDGAIEFAGRILDDE